MVVLRANEERNMNFKPALIAVAAALALNAPAALAEKWDMPMAYAATNFHYEHGEVSVS